MRVISIDPCSDPRWRDLLAAREDATIFHTPEWISTVVETYGFQPQAILALDETETPLAGLPFCIVDDLRGRRAISFPFSDYCDPLVSKPEHWRHLSEAFLHLGCVVQIRCLNAELPSRDPRFHVEKTAAWHGIDISVDRQDLLRGFKPAARRAIKKAQMNGMQVRLGDRDDLDKFYDLHLRNRKFKHRLLPQPREFFALIWDKFSVQNQVFLLVATFENEVVAGILFLKYANVLTYKFNASNPSVLSLRPNDLLLWEGIDLGQRLGCDLLDFGLTDSTDAGLARYKMKFATHGKAITYITNRDLPKTDSPLAGITELLTEADVPDELTERAGALLYRYFA